MLPRQSVCVLVVLLVLHTAIGQNYHFSNGWLAGRKRSGNTDAGCTFKKDTLMLVNKLILEEASRISRLCHPASPNMEFPEQAGIDNVADNQLAEKRWK